jgi:S-adenosylmethionine hydrolase
MLVLFTDFGLDGPYTGQVNAVLQREAPGVPVIQLFADAPTGQPKPAAYLLAAYADWFPPGAVLLCVVDPGVGGDRRAVIAESGGRIFVGPDNGLFELVLRRGAQPHLWEITWQPASLSTSFHGRDLFAPVAARLAHGTAPNDLAKSIEIVTRRDWPDDLAEIVYIDHYGNALTGLRGDRLVASARLHAAGRVIAPAKTFSAVPAGEAFWYVNSNGLVEIAVNSGRADTALGLAIGTPIAIG